MEINALRQYQVEELTKKLDRYKYYAPQNLQEALDLIDSLRDTLEELIKALGPK